jgi:hypothetical protein
MHAGLPVPGDGGCEGGTGVGTVDAAAGGPDRGQAGRVAAGWRQAGCDVGQTDPGQDLVDRQDGLQGAVRQDPDAGRADPGRHRRELVLGAGVGAGQAVPVPARERELAVLGADGDPVSARQCSLLPSASMPPYFLFAFSVSGGTDVVFLRGLRRAVKVVPELCWCLISRFA